MTHPAIRDLFQSLSRDPAFQDAVSRLIRDPRARLSLSGLTTTAKALYIVLLWQATERNLVVVVDGNKQADALGELVDTFFDLLVTSDLPRPQTIPALDVLPAQRMSPHSEISEQRAIGLWRMASRKTSITITPVASALLRTEAAEFYRQLALTLRVGEEIPLRRSAGASGKHRLREARPGGNGGRIFAARRHPGYFPGRSIQADSHRAVRRSDRIHPKIRCGDAALGDEDRRDHAAAAGRISEIARAVSNSPIRWMSRARRSFSGWEFMVPLVRPRTHSLFSLTENPVVVVDEPEQAAARCRTLLETLGRKVRSPISLPAGGEFFHLARAARQSGRKRRTRPPRTGAPHQPPTTSHQRRGRCPRRRPPRGRLSPSTATSRPPSPRRAIWWSKAIAWSSSGESSGELERLADIFQEYSVPFQLGLDPADATRPYLAERSYVAGASASTFLVKGLVRRGVVFPAARIAVFGSEDLFDSSDLVAKPGPTKSQLAAFTADMADLKPGDYVVHEAHGIGRFLGTREIAQGDNKGDFMLLEYAGDAKLYVPLTRLDLIQKYRGAGEGAAPALDRLGGVTWERTKSRVKAKMRDMADELLKLYAQRRMAEGFRFSPDSNWQREFEDAFEFTETKDQLSAIKQIKKDMESAHPMDRLLCGDVGYGKTEVAMRAAFKGLGDGKQMAVLAPTTVLAYQHFETFKRRFAAFPVRIEMLSRFRDKKEIAEVLEGLAEGKVDIVIGTHRLLSKDVEFRDLGLLVVDEEQRFGVRHKERIKQLKHNVDVLTMSATPIPRTLHMSLVGLRDMSVIETPPKDRLAIHTVVAHFGNELIKTAIEQEIAPRRPGVLHPQSRGQHLYARGADSGAAAGRARRRRPRADGRSGAGARAARLHAARIRRVRVHHHRRERARHSAGEHDDHRERRALRPVGAVSVARAEWGGRIAERMRTCWSRPTPS